MKKYIYFHNCAKKCLLPSAFSYDYHIQRLDFLFHCLVAPLLHQSVRLLRLANCLSIMAVSHRKFVTDAIKCCIHVCADGKGHQIQPRSVEHNTTFRT